MMYEYAALDDPRIRLAVGKKYRGLDALDVRAECLEQ